MDKNKLVRFFLLSVTLLVYFQIFKPKTKHQPVPPIVKEGVQAKPVNDLAKTPFMDLTHGEKKDITVENEFFKIILSTEGGAIKNVLLKQYKDKHGQPLVLLDHKTSNMGLSFYYKQALVETKNLYFQTTANASYKLQETEEAKIIFRLVVNASQYLEQSFEFTGNSYKINYTWTAVGMEKYMGKQSTACFLWDMDMKDIESDTKSDVAKSTINYYLSNEAFDSLKTNSTKLEEKKLRVPIKWISIKQRFFSSAIIASNVFASGKVSLDPILDQDGVTKSAKLSLRLSKEDKSKGHGSYTFFFGPNDYNILRKVTKGFQQNLPLGWVIVRFVNQGLIIPLFTFLEKYFSNYGLIICFLVIILKLLLAPLSYKSFISMAKIKLLKPELDNIKAKYGNDLQKVQAEQMMLYRELNINPLSGAVPILLQMPILLAIFNFLPNALSLRQARFFWASDLSTHDSILTLPFSIPVYGDHVSLFTILMVISTMLYTWSSSQGGNTEGPMKILSYIMPISVMFVLNSFPAGLSFYYFISNIVSCLQQLVTKYFVNEEELKAKLISKQKRGKQGLTASFQKRVTAFIQHNKSKEQ
ncbi:MAG: membrane protein insertase YidC [Amoebophilaceae bacterium]|nr:membrane protein insertase YidC [Amoebophilaceae bacterium]